MEILLALALLGVVFLTAAHSDTVSARQQMATTIRYIREQCNRYNRIELASETKSLMRVMESVGQIARQMEAGRRGARAAFRVCADGICLRAGCDGRDGLRSVGLSRDGRSAPGSLANIWIPPRCWTRRFTPKSATPRALPARTGA